jgi:AcrR family transcriptional regulator
VSTTVRPRPYHHGDLRNALISAGVELARQGGPAAIVLREAARRVGVSPNAAYRHFTDLSELVDAVAERAFATLAESMTDELAKCRPSGDAQIDAWQRLRATGRGYVHFAVAEPGLFAVAFDSTEGDPRAGHEPVPGPWGILIDALQGLVAAGLLAPDSVDAAASTAWSTVHGLSLLLLGPMRQPSAAARERMIEATLDMIGTGLRQSRG